MFIPMARSRGFFVTWMTSVAVAMVFVSTAEAQTVPTYTGCYNASSGTVTKMRIGTTPLSTCNASDLMVSFSGGDITKITVEGGLSGGGDNGEITIKLDPKFSLPQGCFNQAIAKWNGSAWVCSVDEDTTYTAGTGLRLGSSQFSVDPAYQLPQGCADGQLAVRNGSTWSCLAPPAPIEVWTKFVGAADAPEGSPNEVIRLNLPAGTFWVQYSGLASDEVDGDDEIAVSCQMVQNSGPLNASMGANIGSASDGLVQGALVAQRIVTLTQPGFVSVRCVSGTGSDVVDENVLTAFKVATVHVQ